MCYMIFSLTESGLITKFMNLISMVLKTVYIHEANINSNVDYYIILVTIFIN